MRLQGKAKLGFYPTPPEIVEMIAEHVMWPDETGHAGNVWMLDPSCGEAEALTQFASFYGRQRTILYGVELSITRAKMAATQLDRLVQAGATGVTYPQKEFDVCWFNPPYDWDQDTKVMELTHFEYVLKQKRILRADGLYIGILPRRHMKYMMAAHLNLFTDCSCYRFPDPYYEQFEQVVFLGRQRHHALGYVSEKLVQAWVDFIESDKLPDLNTTAQDIEQIAPERANYARYEILSHPADRTPGKMQAEIYNATRGHEAIMKAGMIRNPAFIDPMFGTDDLKVQVARPPSKGHLSMMLAGGVFNDIVVDARKEGLGVYLLKATTEKGMRVVEYEEFDDGGSIEVKRTHIKSHVYATNLMTGKTHEYSLDNVKSEPDIQAEDLD